ncbi:hypothetical protein BDI4_1080021 [Burkholderia diffusa]|nr:hypothetical protein BDI4_1080021 [Burkholderia diffusa]
MEHTRLCRARSETDIDGRAAWRARLVVRRPLFLRLEKQNIKRVTANLHVEASNALPEQRPSLDPFPAVESR